jgi:hypothetical protein
MDEPIPNKDEELIKSAERVADGVFRWVWPRKPLGKPPGGKGAKGAKGPSSRRRSSRPSKKHPMPSWD